MPVVFLTSASTSPWSKPGDWSDAGHTVELVGAGGQSGAASTGTTGRGGAGGGGGSYGILTRTSGAMAGTTPFAVKVNNSTASQTTNATIWEATTAANAYYVGPGQPGATTTAGAAGSGLITVGTPSPITYSANSNTGRAGGAANTGVTGGGGGGGGAGGPVDLGAVGGAGGSVAGGGGGGGGAGNNGGGSGATTATTSGAAGGAGVGPSHGGGAGSTSTTSPGNGSAGVGGQGGGGGAGSAATTTSMVGSGYAGGPNGNATNWTQTSPSATAGAGAGGGGGGGFSGNVTVTSAGGAGGSYGGGGGGPGGSRGTNSGGVGQGASGLIVITYTSANAPLQGTAGFAGAGALTADLTLSSPSVGAGSSVTFSNNVLHYTFDGDSLPTIVDSSGNSNTGTIQGSGTTLASGKVGTNALSFNGSGYIGLTSAALLGIPTGTSEFSASCWIKCITVVATAAIFEFRDVSGNGIIHFGLGFNGAAGNSGAPSLFLRSTDGSGGTQLLSTTDISDNNWHHLAFTRNSSKLVTIYIDGVVDCSVTDSITTAITPTVAQANIGEDVLNLGITPFLGSLDDVQVYSRALTSTEINTIYVAGITPPAPPVQFMYTKRRFVFWRR